jgi:predicted acyltransferase
MLLMAGFYTLVGIRRGSRWAFPLIVVGMNSIAAYCMAHLFEEFIVNNLTIHLGRGIFKILGESYESLVRGGLVLLIMWSILLWMHRRKIFLRI